MSCFTAGAGNGDIVREHTALMTREMGVGPVDDSCGEMSDNELVAASQRDPAAFGPLYGRYRDRIYDFVLRRIGDPHHAEDITSQVFERALKALPAYRTQAQPIAFRAWLFTIARNAVTDSHRRARTQIPVEHLHTISDPDPGPAERALATEAREELRHLLDALSGQQRRIVELRLAGLSGQEIADELGMSLAAMKSAQYRAFAKIRDLMANPLNGGASDPSRNRPRNEP